MVYLFCNRYSDLVALDFVIILRSYFQSDERAKLALLVKTWRAKFEKAHAANRQHSEYRKALEAEIERLKEEKNT